MSLEPSATSYELRFSHHNKDGSVNLDSLRDVSQRFRFIREQVSMTAPEIIALANHLCAHFDMRGMTSPAPIQAIRTSTRVQNNSLTRKHHPVLSRFPKKDLPFLTDDEITARTEDAIASIESRPRLTGEVVP